MVSDTMPARSGGFHPRSATPGYLNWKRAV